jgi:hypothetical protein
MILNDGVEDTVCFHTGYRTRTALINALGYAVWKTGLTVINQTSEGVITNGLEIRGVLNDYFSEHENIYYKF